MNPQDAEREQDISPATPHLRQTSMKKTFMCFVCGRCKYPICTSDEIILDPVDGGTTKYAFQYDLDCLFDTNDTESKTGVMNEAGVPCYSGDETVLTSVSVSGRILDFPLTPAARLLALESVVQSQKKMQEQEKIVMARHRSSQTQQPLLVVSEDGNDAGRAPPEEADVQVQGNNNNITLLSLPNHPAEVRSHGAVLGGTSEPQPQTGREQVSISTTSNRENHNTGVVDANSQINSSIRPLQCYGTTSDLRVDLVCLKEEVLGHGLKLSTQDRSTWVGASKKSGPPTQTECPETTEEDSDHSTPPSTRPAWSPRQGTLELPQTVLDAISVPPAPTRWDYPGNLSVEEGFVTVRRRTTSASCATWFKRFHYVNRVECPDCHMPLGFLFQRRKLPAGRAAQPCGARASLEPTSEEKKEYDQDVTPRVRYHPQQEQAEDAEDVALNEEMSPDLHNKFNFPNRFIGLELKRITQRTWGLRDFHERLAMSKTLETFRAQFPEAEELQSLYGRLTALRTQSELYNNLLRKHKEQTDVQNALLHSQKSRISTYEDKLITMQRIINTQRVQLKMQTEQVKQQDDLLSSHRNQLNTLRQQMRVENMLLTEQTKTIESQREQIRVMKTHLGIQVIQERLNARRLQLEKQLRGGKYGNDITTYSAEEVEVLSPSQQQEQEVSVGRDISKSDFTTRQTTLETREGRNRCRHINAETCKSESPDELQSWSGPKPACVPRLERSPSSLSNSNSKPGDSAPHWLSYPSPKPERRSFAVTSISTPIESNLSSPQNHNPPCVLNPDKSRSAQYLSQGQRSSNCNKDPGASNAPHSTSSLSLSSRYYNSPVAKVENVRSDEHQGVCRSTDSGFGAINVAYRRSSRLPPVHLRGVVSTNVPTPPSTTVPVNSTQDEVYGAENHSPGSDSFGG